MIRLLTFLMVIVFGGQLSGQYFPYYGKNKVVQITFRWNVLQTDHFRIHYYLDDQDFIKRLATIAEEAYSHHARFLGIEIEERIPLIYYNKQTEIEQTNIYPGLIPPGSFEGFSEPLGNRVVIYGNRSFSELKDLIVHELSHIFTYELLFRGASLSAIYSARFPLWLAEGYAEFMVGKWDSFSRQTVLDLIVNEMMPEIAENGDLDKYYNARTPYDVGHLLLEFIYQQWGRLGVKKFLESHKASIFSRSKTVYQFFQIERKDFNYRFRRFYRERFKEFFNFPSPDDYGPRIGPDYPYLYSFYHQPSPSGELIAIATANYRDYDLDIVLLNGRTGKVFKNISPGLSAIYDSLAFKFNPEDGRTFDWDKNGEQLAIFARKEYRSYLLLINILNNRIEGRYTLPPELQKPANPLFDPEMRGVYFTAFEKANSSLYYLELSSGQVNKIKLPFTNIRGFDLSSEGKHFVFSVQAGGQFRLLLYDRQSEAYRLISLGESNLINPAFDQRDEKIFFSSDLNGVYNIFSYDIATGTFIQLSNSRAPMFFPQEAENGSKLLVSVYNRSTFALYRLQPDLEISRYKEQPEAQEAFFARRDEEEFAPYAGGLTQKYNPLGKIVFNGLPSVTAAVTSGGQVLGSAYLQFSDLLGDHNLFFIASSVYGYRAYHLAYLNQKRRLQYLLHLYYDQEGYYLYLDDIYYLSLAKEIGGTFNIYYPLNRSLRVQTGASFYKYEYAARDFSLISGKVSSLNLAFVGETTRFAEYGPNSGYTFYLGWQQNIKLFADSFSSYILNVDLRRYFRINNEMLFAVRLWGFYSDGRDPFITYTGGNNTIRSTDYNEIVGNRIFFANAEFRFPLISRALTPIGLIGPLRAVLFFDVGGSWFKGENFSFFENGSGMQLKDAISSYGFGLHFFLFGYPLHLDWVYKTDWKSSSFQGVKFWIGFDF